MTGDKVSQWLDQSGNGNHLTQNDLNAQPTYTENVLNGLPILRFDFDDLEGTIGSLSSATIFAIARYG